MTIAELFSLITVLDARSKAMDSQQKTIIVMLANLDRKLDDLDKHFNDRLTTIARQNERVARNALNIDPNERAIAKPKNTKNYDT